MTSPRQAGSPIRYVLGAVCLIGAMVALPAGFILLVRALDRGGYGTERVTYALLTLGLGGGLLGLGIALLIWEISVRYNIRH